MGKTNKEKDNNFTARITKLFYPGLAKPWSQLNLGSINTDVG